jgi:FkbM family methyltransferase
MNGKLFLKKIIDIIYDLNSINVYKRGGIIDSYVSLNKSWFRDLKIDVVLDIGANVGKYAATIRAVLPKAKIYCFEPIPDCASQIRKLMKGDSNLTICNYGLGSEDKDLFLNVNEHSPSSSFLEMSDEHKAAFPFTEDSKKISLKVKRLDDLDLQLHDKNVFVKIDVQGFEKEVILGGKNTFSNVKAIVVELSFSELYKGQSLFSEINEMLVNLGFKFCGILSQMDHPQTGIPLDADCLFIKNS